MNLIDQMDRAVLDAPSFRAAAKLACVILRKELSHYTWAGVYMLYGQELVLEEWDGEHATQHTKIRVGRGLCGLAAVENRAVVVKDVREEPRYVACFQSTRSEIVVPVRNVQGKFIGEIDCDSDEIGAFHATDLAFLEWLADRLSQRWRRELEAFAPAFS
ncbi:MAG: GAF domain-containing protein [Planctomycetes bacterium]|nr:GAF domain-containing protein [Planctomycetota bacterium]